MQKYEFIEDRQKNSIIVNYGELGACQLLCHKQTKQFCVLKLAPKLQALKDIQCLTQINHPNIIRILNYFDHEDSTLIIFQFLETGDLYSKIRCGQIKKQHIPSVFRGICKAVEYIHSRKIIHRNLKTETILLDKNFNPKIIDFGLAARLSTRKTYCGCCYYMSPQILQNKQYNQKADVWALGIILYEMIYGDVPFLGETADQILNQLQNWEFFRRKYPKGSAQQLIDWMLSLNAAKRPSVKQVLAHSYLSVEPFNFLTQQNIKTKRSKTQNQNKIIQKVRIAKQSLSKTVDRTEVESNNKTCCVQWKMSLANKCNALKNSTQIRHNLRFNYVVNP